VLDRERTPSASIRTVVINSGNANACTGEQGMADAVKMAELAAMVCAARPEEALVMSTGIIGEYLPMDRIEQGITSAAVKLGRSAASVDSAARGILTTDTRPKVASRTIEVDGRTVTLLGMAKGAGMIGPRMATLLGVILTDAPLEPDTAQAALGDVVARTFNCVSVDGHTSTNDTVLLLANGAAGGEPLTGPALESFTSALDELAEELARAIPDDGEGTQHLITIDVTGCADRASAVKIARAVADSPLVKTAVAGADPNWGRIVSAAGYAGVAFDPTGVSLTLNDTPLFRAGSPVEFDADAVSRGMRQQREVAIHLSFTEGDAGARFWTSDLTAEYVRINADYHT
jgi:glutamate N-acetyltransferase/amino-acid N-acetyltransferase